MNELNNNLNIKQDDMLNKGSEIDMNNSQNYNHTNNEELIDAYIGKGAEKIRKGKFSLWTCFFGTAYVFYRKMWLLGLVWYLINIFIALTAAFITLKVFNIVELLQSSTYSITTIVVFVSSCIVNIIISFLFKKLYIKKSEKKVEKIKQKNSNKTNEELKKICAKKGGTTIIGIVVAILLSGVVETICEPIVEKIVSNEIHNKFAKETAYSIISEVEYAYTQAFLTSGKDTLTLEDIKNEYNVLSSTWNKDNTITSKHYDVVCNVTVNNDNKIQVSCDVNGKIIESEPLSMNLNQNNNENIDEKDRISFNIINETIEGGVNLKKLYINNKLVDLKGSYSGIKVTQLNDILIVEATNSSSTLFAVDKNANLVSVFVPENNNYYENIQKIVTKYNYRDTYRIDDNNLYITTDRLSQDSQYIVCNMITNDNDIVVYEEKFTYLGNNKFSNSVVVNTITRKQYMQEHNISCNKPVEDNSQNTNNLLTESEALELGEELYEYANNVAWDKEFEYIHNQPDGSLILNYEEVISKFTQKYISSTGNIFSTIKKGDDGKYYDSSVRGFGVSCAKVSLTDLNVTNISNNYITFDAIATTTSTSKECGGLEVGTVVRTDKQTFGIKKENDVWKIDVYEFQYVTE